MQKTDRERAVLTGQTKDIEAEIAQIEKELQKLEDQECDADLVCIDLERSLQSFETVVKNGEARLEAEA